MGRPREHDDATAAALLAAAERILDQEGLSALSLRRLAEAAGTTTRAVYSLFGNKDGLIVALSRRAFDLLGDAIANCLRPQTLRPTSSRPAWSSFADSRSTTPHCSGWPCNRHSGRRSSPVRRNQPQPPRWPA